MAKHTSGKWDHSMEKGKKFQKVSTPFVQSGNQTIAIVYGSSDEEAKANAKIISQSPVMLSMLYEEVDYLEEWIDILEDDVEKYSGMLSQMNERKEFIEMTIKRATA